MIIITTRAEIKPARWQEALNWSKGLSATVKNEPYCTSFHFYMDKLKEHTLFVFEEWIDESAFMQHIESDAMQEFLAYLMQVTVDNDLEIKRYDFHETRQII